MPQAFIETSGRPLRMPAAEITLPIQKESVPATQKARPSRVPPPRSWPTISGRNINAMPQKPVNPPSRMRGDGFSRMTMAPSIMFITEASEKTTDRSPETR